MRYPHLDTIRVATPRYIADPSTSSQIHTTDVLVIGGGLAGLTAALIAAEHTDVTLLARVTLTESNSAWAQGGIAAALDHDDTPRAHVEDTLIAGAGLSDQAAVEVLTSAAQGLCAS
ncbi:MAG: FAD-dependent oxidoreductase [Roseiflexaceae bacterium]|nr:FAD-dependent oxidoreductase [Roseiflexaceae bacterium]